MAIARRKRREANIDVTSFSDIAFLLIIFFILTTTFVKPAGRKMEIPSGASNAEKSERTYENCRTNWQ